MNKEYFTDNISDETLAKLIDEALNYETTKKNKNIKLDLLKIIPAVAMVAIVVGAINILSYFSMVDEGDVGSDENVNSAVTATTYNLPPNDLEESPASDFEYEYDAELSGVVIQKYTGTSERVRIPEKIEGEPIIVIGEDAFANSGIVEIYIPNTVTRIANNAFYHCEGLTDVTIPASTTQIGGEAFDGCTGLKNITIPDSVTEIGGWAFFRCAGLTNITIPNGVTEIGIQTFYGCAGLTNITIPDGVTEIGRGAFADCTGLTNIAIPDSVTKIGDRVFSGCTGYATYRGNSYDLSNSDDLKELYYAVDLYSKHLSEPADPYAHVRFGETRDILLLEVEWHTYDTYLQSIEDFKSRNQEHSEEDWYKALIIRMENNLKSMSENKYRETKTINGKDDVGHFGVTSDAQEGINISDYVDSNGYYILKVYPYMPYVQYTDENGEIQTKIFDEGEHYGSDLGFAGSKRWYDLMLEEQIIPFCNKLLEKGLLTQEMYDYYTTLDPLDYYADLYFGRLLEPADPYAHVRFGETRDILLLDVEWHTYDTYLQSIEDFKSQNAEHSEEDWYKARIIGMENNLESMSENKFHQTKTINGKDDIGYLGVNSDAQEGVNISDYADSNGYYILNVYPYMPYVAYTDENGVYQTKVFDKGGYYGADPGMAGSKKWYDLMMEEQIIPFCNILLEKGLITHEIYIRYITLDPLEYYADLYFGHLK